MKKAFSQIAWNADEEPEVLRVLRTFGFTGIEVAPTIVWPAWQKANVQSAQRYRDKLALEGFEIPALQAVLYGKPECQLFGGSEAKASFIRHLEFVAELAAGLGASVVVLGAPKSRQRNGYPMNEALEQAVPVFRHLACVYANCGVTLGLEANPPEYDCDFITSAMEAKALVSEVGHPGFRLHLDAAQMHMSAEDLGDFLRHAVPAEAVCHYHVSNPFLDRFLVAGKISHSSNLCALHESGYANWASVEMRRQLDSIEAIRFAASEIQKWTRPLVAEQSG